MGGNGNWSPETDDFILRNVLYLLYGADKIKGNKAYKSPGILKNPKKLIVLKRLIIIRIFLIFILQDIYQKSKKVHHI